MIVNDNTDDNIHIQALRKGQEISMSNATHSARLGHGPCEICGEDQHDVLRVGTAHNGRDLCCACWRQEKGDE